MYACMTLTAQCDSSRSSIEMQVLKYGSWNSSKKVEGTAKYPNKLLSPSLSPLRTEMEKSRSAPLFTQIDHFKYTLTHWENTCSHLDPPEVQALMS